MSRQLYEEALADAKKIRQLAEDNARRAVIEAVTPKIRDLIERQLVEAADDGDGDEDDADGIKRGGAEDPANKEVLTDLVAPTADSAPDKDAIAAPAPDGTVTIDLAALGGVSAGATEPAVAPPAISQAPGAAPPVPAPPAPVVAPVMPANVGSSAIAPPAIPAAPAPIMPPPVIGNSVPPGDAVAAVPPIDGAVLPEDQPVELSLESLMALKPILGGKVTLEQLKSVTNTLGENVNRFKAAGSLVRRSEGYAEKIAEMISRTEDMYDYVQEAADAAPAEKRKLATKLEAHYVDLTQLMELKMAKNRIHESDVTLKLTGLPEDIDLEQVGVDLIQDEGEEGAEGAEGAEGDEGMEGGDELDFGADDGAGDDDLAEEGADMSDDTVVEIDEGMLRREIARMKKINEFKVPAIAAAGEKGGKVDDFGGGKDDGEPWIDHDVTTADDLKEGDEAELDEAEELDELQDRRYGDESGKGAQAQQSDTGKAQFEAASRRVAFEKRLQERISTRIANLKKEHAAAKKAGASKKMAEIKATYGKETKRLSESKARSEKYNKLVSESAQRNATRPNVGAGRSAESKTEEALRRELAESNLFNTKLLHANKLLQNESLTPKQKAQVIERLDEARSPREVKLVYDSLTKTLTSAKPMTEGADRKTGSSSRPTRSGAGLLNESSEAARWAKLAGITNTK